HGATLSIKTEGEDYAKGDTLDISDLFYTHAGQVPEGFGDVDPALMQSFSSGLAKVHDRRRLPKEFDGAHNGHEGSHHFLADDFVRAVTTSTQPPVNAWTAARFTPPGVIAYESAKQGGARLPIPALGEGPAKPTWCAAGPEREPAGLGSVTRDRTPPRPVPVAPFDL